MEISREQRLEVIKEWCNAINEKCRGNSCTGCELKGSIGCIVHPNKVNPEKAFNIIYPKRKTYKEDFLEKFPNADIWCDCDKDTACINDIYGLIFDSSTCCDIDNCEMCWNQEMDDTK